MKNQTLFAYCDFLFIYLSYFWLYLNVPKRWKIFINCKSATTSLTIFLTQNLNCFTKTLKVYYKKSILFIYIPTSFYKIILQCISLRISITLNFNWLLKSQHRKTRYFCGAEGSLQQFDSYQLQKSIRRCANSFSVDRRERKRVKDGAISAPILPTGRTAHHHAQSSIILWLKISVGYDLSSY